LRALQREGSVGIGNSGGGKRRGEAKRGALAVIRMRCASARTHSGGDSVEDKFILIESCVCLCEFVCMWRAGGGSIRRAAQKREKTTSTQIEAAARAHRRKHNTHWRAAPNRVTGIGTACGLCASARHEDGL
jgi:hypothetical protein